jgi:hypothetical protein
MAKFYVMLFDPINQQMRVPVKALLNPYSGEPAFCAGMPQFFGGTDGKRLGPVALLKHEVTEESRRTLELTTDDAKYFFGSAAMGFYWTGENEWEETGTAWGPGQGRAEKEMDRIAIVELARFDAQWDDGELIAELIRQTGSEGAPPQGKADFNGSATREAFIQLLGLLLLG